MFKHYLKTASRFLRRNKLYTGINALGLTLSLAASFIILLFVINELSYNHCHKKRDQVFRVLNYYGDFNTTMAGTPYVLAKTLKQEYPQVIAATNTRYLGFKLKLSEEFINVPRVMATDSEVFDIFTIPLVEGSADQNLLEDMNSIVLSRSQAEKFFPGENPVGKEIIGIINNTEQLFIVKGVFEDLPKNSTFRAECFVNSRWTLEPINQTFNITNADMSWTHNFWRTWVLISKDGTAAALEDQFRDFEVKYIYDKPVYHYSLQTLSDIYLKSEEVMNTGIKGNLKNIRLFSTVAFLIILIAAINYIILSIAVSTGRTKEIGIRKTTGASIRRIRNQLFSESITLAMLVLPLALLMMWLARPYAEKLFQTSLIIIPSNIAVYVTVYLVLTILIGIASGLYASSYLSRLKVLDVLKKNLHFGRRRKIFSSILIVIQLIIFCSFVSSTLIIRSQYQFILNKDPGYYNRDILLINLGRNFGGYTAFMDGLRANPHVIKAAGVMEGLPMLGSMSYMQPHFQDEEVKVQVEGLAIDYGFLETMGINFLEGRDFSQDYGGDLTGSVILNETAVNRLGIIDPVGKQLDNRTIIGVVKDFNLHSLHSDIPPLDIQLTDKYIHQVALRYHPGTLDVLLPTLEAEWEETATDLPFNYSTIEELTENLYSSEKNLSTILSISALFTLLIAAFGLFGLTLFIARSRTNEIGVRKVFGSSERLIIYSFLRSNLVLVFTAGLLSIPITYHFISKWLNNFAFKVGIGWWVFLVAFLIACVVVLFTVYMQSFKASRLNPVDALRYE
jgi:putative ABC transport system permease protein